MRRRQFDVNCLMFFATVGAIALLDFLEAAAVAFLFSLSEWLEARATTRARKALSAIVNLRPEKANLIHPRTKELIDVPVRAVPVGAVVSVRSGDEVPCDGMVIEGSTTMDESVSCFGASLPLLLPRKLSHLNLLRISFRKVPYRRVTTSTKKRRRSGPRRNCELRKFSDPCSNDEEFR